MSEPDDIAMSRIPSFIRAVWFHLLCAVSLLCASTGRAQDSLSVKHLTLAECIDEALRSNHVRPASRLAVEIAEAQHAQAMSSWWPRATLTSSLSLRDENPTFIFPEDTDTYSINLGGQPLATAITIPAKRIDLQDRLDSRSDIDLLMPLYTGGLRGAIIRQAQAGIDAAQQAARRTDLELTYDVRRYYHAAVMAQNLTQISEDALARLRVTMALTENLYRHGSGTVTKTDWLQHKVVVEGLHSVVEALRGNRDLARAALANTMGMPWNQDVVPTAPQIPVDSIAVDLADLVQASYRFNPDWGRLQAGLDAAAAVVDEAGSGRMPKVALVGNVEFIANKLETGMVPDEEKKSWLVALAVEVPLFDGFLTRNRMREARARLRQLEHQQERLREGLGLQVKAIFIQLMQAQRQETASRAAVEAATQNRELNVRAHQDQLVEIEDVIRAQITESFVLATYEKVRFDHADARARLELTIGREMAAQLGTER